MFGNLTDDEDSFLPTSSNLASLFRVTNASTDNTSSLTYTAPKQPTTSKTVEPKSSKVQSSLIIFKEVHALKLVDKKYVNLGKCGFAFIGNESIKAYQLLLYKQKNHIICSVKFSNEFQFNERTDNYATFLDDDKVHWTVHFGSDADLNEFSQALKKHGGKVVKNLDGKSSPPLTKNIATSTIETKNTSTGTEKKDLKSSDVEHFINKIDSELSDSSNSNAKATILSRMAKMGQKLLPNNSISDGTDSDTDKERKKSMPYRRPKRGSSTPNTPSVGDMEPHKSEMNKSLPVSLPTNPPAYTFMNGQYVPIMQSPYVPPTQYHHSVPVENVSSPIMYSLPSQPSVDQLQLYFTENRTHNSEVRMNILRLTDKMELVLSKINTLETKTSQNSSSMIDKSELESLQKENEKLKNDLEKLYQQIEKSKEMEQRHSELIDKQMKLLQSNDEMKNIIASHKEIEIKYVTRISELESTVAKQTEKIKEYETSTKEKVNIDETIKKLLNSLYSDIDGQIPDDESFLGRDIKTTLAKKFVDNAYSIIAVVGETQKREKSENLK